MNEKKAGGEPIAAKTSATPAPPRREPRVPCRVCGRKVEESRARVPAIPDLARATGLGLEALAGQLGGHAYCPRCSWDLRERVQGARFFDLPGTRREIEKRLAERAARAEALRAEAERIRAGRALSRPVLAPVAMKVTGKDGRPLVGAAAAAVVGRALRAQPGFGSGKTRAERKAARRAAEKAGRDAALARGAALTAVALGDPLPGANGNGDGAN